MRTRQCLLIAVGCLLVTACGASPFLRSAESSVTPSVVAESPLPSESPTPTLYQPPPLANASRTNAPEQLPAGVACRVPYAEISEARGGFILYPGGQRQSDPNSVVAMPGSTPGEVGVNSGLTYNSATDKWAPVGSEWVAPNGLFYVYDDWRLSGKIRAVTIADGSSGDVTTDGGWYIIGTSDIGVFLGKAPLPGAGPIPGAWFVAFGKAPARIIELGLWSRFFEGGLWMVDGGGNLVRLDVATGAETVWGKGLLSVSWVVGFDLSGQPIVNTGGALAIYRANGAMIAIWPGTNGLSAGGRAAADNMGIWFSVGGGLVGAPGHGVYLWRAGKGAQLISAPEVNIGGPCGT
jgi:hypothetical protein